MCCNMCFFAFFCQLSFSRGTVEDMYVSIGGCACDRSDNLGGKVDVNKVSLVTFAEHDVRFEIRSQKV